MDAHRVMDAFSPIVRHWFRTSTWWKPWLVFVLISVMSRFPYFFHGDIDWDESTFILLGQSVLEGHLPYTDVLDVKPPLLWYGFAVLIFLGGKTFLGFRTLGAIVVTIIAYFSYCVAGHIWGQKTGWIAGVSWIILINLAAGGQAVLSEHLALLFLGAGFSILVIFTRGFLNFWGVGFLMTLAALVRLNLAYTGVCLGVYLGIRVVMSWHQDDRSQAKQHGLELLAFSMGGLSGLGMMIIPYILTHNLPILYTGFIHASLSYTAQNSILSVLWSQFQKVIFLRLSVAAIVLSIILFWALGVHGRWVWEHRHRLTPKEQHFYTLVALFILSIEFSIVQTGAFYSHYTIQFLFFISFLMAKPIQTILDYSKPSQPQNYTPTWLSPYLKLSLGLVILHHLLQYGLIISLGLTRGTAFYGDSFDIETVIRSEQVQGQPLWIQTNHLAYWLTDSPPATPAIVHPSNITKPFLLQAWYGETASSVTELQKIIDRHPALIISKGDIATYFRQDPKAQNLLNTVIRDEYKALEYQYQDLQFYRKM